MICFLRIDQSGICPQIIKCCFFLISWWKTRGTKTHSFNSEIAAAIILIRPRHAASVQLKFLNLILNLLDCPPLSHTPISIFKGLDVLSLPLMMDNTLENDRWPWPGFRCWNSWLSHNHSSRATAHRPSRPEQFFGKLITARASSQPTLNYPQ